MQGGGAVIGHTIVGHITLNWGYVIHGFGDGHGLRRGVHRDWEGGWVTLIACGVARHHTQRLCTLGNGRGGSDAPAAIGSHCCGAQHLGAFAQCDGVARNCACARKSGGGIVGGCTWSQGALDRANIVSDGKCGSGRRSHINHDTVSTGVRAVLCRAHKQAGSEIVLSGGQQRCGDGPQTVCADGARPHLLAVGVHANHIAGRTAAAHFQQPVVCAAIFGHQALHGASVVPHATDGRNRRSISDHTECGALGTGANIARGVHSCDLPQIHVGRQRDGRLKKPRSIGWVNGC